MRVEERRASEWAPWDAAEPVARAHEAIRVLDSGIAFGAFPLDHVGLCEARADAERIVEELGLPHDTFESVVLGRELSLDLCITRIRVRPQQHLELFWLPDGRMPTALLVERAHLAFRAPDPATVERIAARFGARAYEALDGARLAYLSPWLELIAPR